MTIPNETPTPKLGADGKPLTPIRTVWHFSDDGFQLSAPLWWVAYIEPSKKKPGKLWWNTSTCLGSFNVTAARGYVDTPEQALARIREALESDCLYDYTLPPDAEALVSLELIMKHHAHKS